MKYIVELVRNILEDEKMKCRGVSAVKQNL